MDKNYFNVEDLINSGKSFEEIKAIFNAEIEAAESKKKVNYINNQRAKDTKILLENLFDLLIPYINKYLPDIKGLDDIYDSIEDLTVEDINEIFDTIATYTKFMIGIEDIFKELKNDNKIIKDNNDALNTFFHNF